MAAGVQIVHKGVKSIYTVTEEGEVFNSKTGNKLKPWIDGAGYKKFSFRKDGKKYYVPVHRAVAIAFLGYPKELLEDHHGWCVNHIDENKHNNSVSNLEWVTNKQNVIYSRDKLAKEWKLISPEGEEYSFINLNKFCLEHGLNASCLQKVVSGKEGRAQHKGWRAV